MSEVECVHETTPLPPIPTPQEMQLIVQQAQAAPLQNMQHAVALSVAIQRFQEWARYAQRSIAECEATS